MSSGYKTAWLTKPSLNGVGTRTKNPKFNWERGKQQQEKGRRLQDPDGDRTYQQTKDHNVSELSYTLLQVFGTVSQVPEMPDPDVN